MKQFELSISTGYVPDWTYLEAIREFLQNAIDAENSAYNKCMLVIYYPETEMLLISNMNSSLDTKSLLLGSTDKHDNEKMLGQHGEGYKIATMVLLREGLKVHILNGKNGEIWTTRLKKSRKYNALIPVISVEEGRHESTDLEVVISNVTAERFAKVVENTLRLQSNVELFADSEYGEVLTAPEQLGRIYVEGMFVCKSSDVHYGYNLKAKFVRLDRDRRLASSFDLHWSASKILFGIFKQSDKARALVLDAIEKNYPEVEYVDSTIACANLSHAEQLVEAAVVKFKEDNGEAAVPVQSLEEAEVAKSHGLVPILTSAMHSTILRRSYSMQVPAEPEKSAIDRLIEWHDRIAEYLSDDDNTEFNEIVEDL